MTCTACHQLQSPSDRFPRMVRFEKACASCHTAGIVEKELPFFRLPAIPGGLSDVQKLTEICSSVEAKGKEIPKGILLEKPAIASGALLNVDVKDPTSYGKSMKKMISLMAQGDLKEILELVEKNPAASGHTQEMLAGLDPQLLKQAACTWLAGREYSSSLDAAPGTWFVDWLELRYKPKGHADPIAKAWIEFSLRGNQEELRKGILSQSRGVGECMKCHTIRVKEIESKDKELKVEWKSREPESKPLTPNFSHATHLKALGNQACAFCHTMTTESSSSPSRDFRAIPKETCLQCHSAHVQKGGMVQAREDCLLCHTYHNAPTLKKYPGIQ